MGRGSNVRGAKLCARLTMLMLTSASVGKVWALDPLALYESFTATKFSPTKWYGGEGRDDLGLEAKRGIVNDQLQMTTRSVGFTASDAGTGLNRVFLGIPGPDDVNEMKATIAVTALSAPGCASNPTPTQSRAVLTGSFFNVGTPSNGDATGDVVAGIGIYRSSDSIDPVGTLRVFSYVVQCGDEHCDTFGFLGGSPRDQGKIAIGTPVKVEMQWDQPNHQFIFTRGIQPPVDISYKGAVSDANSPGAPFKELAVANDVANCTAATRPIANITATFDNVFLNSSAVP